ncbi:helix-turn-helix domain-containing protein [Metallosphaera sedula]|nr:helix-turn-helix domain-containing protein [Metallosphaera sedula]WPX06150.1 helix-turn-helix domain-containing protein [Metallosphaera sedula DSM 5348]
MKTAREISNETGIKEELVYHVLEVLRRFELVQVVDGKYYSEYSEVAKLLLDLKNLPDGYTITN